MKYTPVVELSRNKRFKSKLLKFLSAVISAISVNGNPLSYAQDVPPYSEIVVDADSGNVLHSSNSDRKTQPASLAKIMTLYVTFKAISAGKIKFTDRVYFSKLAASQKPCKLDVNYGDNISVREAVLALTTKSANDVAVALAEKISGSVDDFVNVMNNYAKVLNMKNTHFTNPSGWKDKKQITTASDMIKLSRAILGEMKNYYTVFSTKNFTYNGKSFKNHNKLLGCHEGNIIVDGIKTGYVAASGFNLVTSATKDNKRVISVVLGGPTSNWTSSRSKDLIKCAFNKEQPPHIKLDSYYNKIKNCSIKRKVAKKRKRKANLCNALSNERWKNQKFRR